MTLPDGILTPEEYKSILESIRNSASAPLEVVNHFEDMLEICMNGLHAIAIHDEAAEICKYAKRVIDAAEACGRTEVYQLPRLK